MPSSYYIGVATLPGVVASATVQVLPAVAASVTRLHTSTASSVVATLPGIGTAQAAVPVVTGRNATIAFRFNGVAVETFAVPPAVREDGALRNTITALPAPIREAGVLIERAGT